jgi:hypothetical protein
LLAYTQAKRPKECALAVESGNVSEPQGTRAPSSSTWRGGGDEEATYKETWQIVNEKTLEGRKLRGMEKAPAGDGVELPWDASDGRRRQG